MRISGGERIVGMLAALLVGGCGGPRVVPVEGVVTLNGRPLTGAVVRFDRATGPIDERSFLGETDTEGRFVLKRAGSDRAGAVPDSYRVFITSVNVPPDANELTPLPKERVPIKYRDGSQSFDVPQEGTSEAHFFLTAG